VSERPSILDLRRRIDGRSPRRLPLTHAERRAAVAIVVRERPVVGMEALLIRRATHPRDPWSGHMAFPGGRQEPSDPDELATAIRETHEELGLDLRGEASLLGRLDDLQAVARGRPVGLTISPFVFELLRPSPLRHNAEVEESVWVELAPLLRGERATTIRYSIADRVYPLPAWDIDGRVVWGLTHQMLSGLLEILRGPGAPLDG